MQHPKWAFIIIVGTQKRLLIKLKLIFLH